jgi:hypothetical protein
MIKNWAGFVWPGTQKVEIKNCWLTPAQDLVDGWMDCVWIGEWEWGPELRDCLAQSKNKKPCFIS